VDNSDASIPGEIADVQGEQVANAVNMHGSDQARIIYLAPANSMSQHQPSPFGLDEFVIRQQDEHALEASHAFISFQGREAVSVPGEGPGANVPEFEDVLGDITDSFTPRFQFVNSLANQRELRIVRFHEPQKDVGISQV
jgi:hypothetical protein